MTEKELDGEVFEKKEGGEKVEVGKGLRKRRVKVMWGRIECLGEGCFRREDVGKDSEMWEVWIGK